MISHYKDSYEPISTIECHKNFEHCSHVLRKQEDLTSHLGIYNHRSPARDLRPKKIGKLGKCLGMLEFFHGTIGLSPKSSDLM